MDRTGHINDLITMYTAMKDEPGVNKKAINKTIARLEEARLWAKEIQPGKVTGVPATQSIKGSTDQTNCTCPPGVVDHVNCPVHKQ
jgi:hypothetical protein